MLADGRLRLPDLPPGSGARDFAFLAACSTSTGGRALPDEALTMVNAFQYAGWRRVVGTLWPVHGYPAGRVTRGFYEALDGTVTPTSDTALALRTATLAECTRHAARPDVWAGYVHVGPTR